MKSDFESAEELEIGRNTAEEAAADGADDESLNGEAVAEEGSAKSGSVEESAEWKELNSKYLRLYAEFENYRRRTARESIEQAERAEWRVLEKLLGVVDNFDRAIAGGAGEDPLALFKGMELIHGQFQELLAGFGLEPVGEVGEQFDPNLHDALMKQPSNEHPEGVLTAIFEKGYKAKAHILRHAKVVVSAGSEEQ